jgi:hypothetical protein
MTFSTNSGSVDSLNVCARCGCSPKSRHIRPMVLDPIQADGGWTAWPVLVDQALQPPLQEPGPPLADGHPVDRQPVSHLYIG